MNISINQNNEENKKNNKGTMANKRTIMGYKNKKINQKYINHPYFSPLVLRKKEIYEIFNAGKSFNNNLEQYKNN